MVPRVHPLCILRRRGARPSPTTPQVELAANLFDELLVLVQILGLDLVKVPLACVDPLQEALKRRSNWPSRSTPLARSSSASFLRA